MAAPGSAAASSVIPSAARDLLFPVRRLPSATMADRRNALLTRKIPVKSQLRALIEQGIASLRSQGTLPADLAVIGGRLWFSDHRANLHIHVWKLL